LPVLQAEPMARQNILVSHYMERTSFVNKKRRDVTHESVLHVATVLAVCWPNIAPRIFSL
ncbi:MAG: hypothetical protein ACP5QZ_12585, partial [Candidatus Sumerlaeaceae bacterium]